MMKNRTCALFVVCLLAGCSQNSDSFGTKAKLDEANKKIATLERLLAIAKSTSSNAEAQQAIPAQEESQAAPLAEPSGTSSAQQWEYERSEDPMSGSARHTATVKSSNTVSFGFPYSGAQHGTLTLRTVQGKGKSVLFYIERGQILCPSYQGCTAQVRFDDEKPMRFAANGPADHSSELIFLEGYGRFVAKLAKAKRVRISVDIYHNGQPAFEFDVSGFDPGRYLSKA